MNLFEVKDLKIVHKVKRGLFKTDEICSVNGISFNVRAKETLSIVGESGCGKSSTARLLIGIDKPTSGQINFMGEDINQFNKAKLRAFRSDVSMIFQDPYSSLNPRWNVEQIIAEPLLLNTNLSAKERRIRVLEIMSKVGLKESAAKRYAHEFSGGQRQRIGIARALILKPKVIICDEPVSALDVSIQAQVLNLLLDLQDEFELTYVFISHDLNVVRHISDRLLVMNAGKIVESGSCDEVFSAPKDEFTKRLISAML